MANKKKIRERLTADERRLRIIDAALNLFAQKGYAGTRTRQIAQAAGISETLIFQHFKTKEELYRAALGQLFYPHPIIPEVAQMMEQKDDAGVLTALAQHVIRESNEDPRILRLAMFSALEGQQFAEDLKQSEKSGPPLTFFLTDYIQRRIEDGAFRKVDARIAAQLFVGNIFMYIADKQVAISSPKPSFSDEEMMNTMVDIYIKGLKKQI